MHAHNSKKPYLIVTSFRIISKTATGVKLRRQMGVFMEITLFKVTLPELHRIKILNVKN